MVTVGAGTGQCGNSRQVQDVGGYSRDMHMTVWQKWRQVQVSLVTAEAGTGQW